MPAIDFEGCKAVERNGLLMDPEMVQHGERILAAPGDIRIRYVTVKPRTLHIVFLLSFASPAYVLLVFFGSNIMNATR